MLGYWNQILVTDSPSEHSELSQPSLLKVIKICQN